MPCTLLVLLLLSIAVRDSAAGTMGLMETNGTVRIGLKAPPIRTVDVNGNEFSLEALKGRPIFIDFGSIICEACADMVLEMNRLVKKYSDTDLAIVMVADGSMPNEMTKAFFTRMKASFTVVRDGEWRFFDDYGVKVVPFKFLIDRQGNLRNMHFGYAPGIDKLMGFKEVLGEGGK